VEEGGRVIYQHEAKPPVPLRSADGVAVYQLKTMLQGVVARGTASSIRALAPFVAGKTGTSENENDAWFAGFSNDVTVVVWVGHDNADRKRRTLGRGQTGGKVAVPIFEAIMKAAWSTRGAPTPLAPPSPETKQLLAGLPIDLRTGDPASPARGAFTEHFRKSSSGGVVDTQYRFVDRKAAYALRGFPSGDGDETPFGSSEPDTFEPESSDGWGRRPQLKADSDWLRPDRYRFAWPDEDGPRRPARRVDPEYLWGPREMY
jgi:membrane peptidoglycan carboxypeptidase